VNSERIGSKATVPSKVVAISGCAPQISAETVSLLACWSSYLKKHGPAP
jgi:hypothetical protein